MDINTDRAWTHSRRSFGQAVRRAKRAGQLAGYDRTYCGSSRVATMRDGTVEIYHPPSYYTPPEPLMVIVCGWCPDARERTAAAIAAGHTVSHGICASCVPLFTGEPLSPRETQDAHLATFGRGK